MIDTIEDAVITVLVVLGSLTGLTAAVLWLWSWWGDDPLGLNGVFKGE
jgi:hypothetical protein